MDAVAIALRYLGAHSGAPFLRFLGLPSGLAWCLAFALFCQHAANPSTRLPRIARCSMFWATVRANPLRFRTFTPDDVAWGIDRPQRGDVAIFNHNPDVQNWAGHAALVEADLGDGRVRTIEGNTSPTVHGDQRNGNVVAEKTRRAGIHSFLLEGFVREIAAH